VRRVHRMPFGAELLPGGGTRFRLWAPAARSVKLCIEGGDALPMEAGAEGWFQRDVPDAGAGTLYRYELEGGLRVPDPASRFNPRDVHGPSRVCDPEVFQWQDGGWRGRPWEDAVIYELHVGTFSREGGYAGVERRLDYLQGLGVTAIELMPISDFSGSRNWGYDGVLPFAPDSAYGEPEALKELVQGAHRRGIMVLLDVVYNHFGPDGNYLHAYAKPFFTERHHTPWGAAINFDGPGSATVRDFFIHNALYWLEEFHLDGLRLDAVHAILDDSDPDFLSDLAEAVRSGPGSQRLIHLVLENDLNQARRLARASGAAVHYTAQWNDDIHHALHVLACGESDGYYADYADDPVGHLGRCLTEGFAYQGQPSPFRGGEPRGEPSAGLPPLAFVNFLQTHDQVGNRAFGERLVALAAADALRAATAVVLLAPSPPLLFMGEEFGAATPFLYFCDFQGELADAVREGRRREFARFSQFADPAARERIPDPNSPETFARSRLDWDSLEQPPHRDWLELHRSLLALRRDEIVPRLHGLAGGGARFARLGERGLVCAWHLGDGSWLHLVANLGAQAADGFPRPAGRVLHAVPEGAADGLPGSLESWTAAWFLDAAGEGGSR